MRKRTLSEAKQEFGDMLDEAFEKADGHDFTVPWPQPNTYRVTWRERLERWTRRWHRLVR